LCLGIDNKLSELYTNTKHTNPKKEGMSENCTYRYEKRNQIFFFGVVRKINDFFFSLLLFLSHLKLQESLAETERKLSVAQE